jgi:hypothetical protein
MLSPGFNVTRVYWRGVLLDAEERAGRTEPYRQVAWTN